MLWLRRDRRRQDGFAHRRGGQRDRGRENRHRGQDEARLPPLYVLTSACLEKGMGIARLQQAIEDIRKSIKGAGGNLTVKIEPKAVTESDDAELQALMEKRERENAEVSGDESVSVSDDIPETI